MLCHQILNWRKFSRFSPFPASTGGGKSFSEDGFVASWRDVTPRKQREETIRHQLGEIEAIYTAVPIGLCFVDTELRFVRINEQLAKINGLPVSEHIGRTLGEVLPEMAPQLEPLYQQVIASGKPILNLEVKGTICSQPGVERYWLQVESQVQIRITDTGIGIAPEFLPSIFERFQQGQKNTGSSDGLGLGLAIVKNLVELHSGTITAESQGVGLGATFTVLLPLLKDSVKESSDDVVVLEEGCLAGIRVLVVDDEVDMLNLITFVLKETGAEVQSATSSFEALQHLPQFKPDIVVSDIAMPESNGYELVQKMKSHPEGQIPAIALTAYASTTHKERSLQAGFARHLTKPVEPVDLVAAIINLVKGKTRQINKFTQNI